MEGAALESIVAFDSKRHTTMYPEIFIISSFRQASQSQSVNDSGGDLLFDSNALIFDPSGVQLYFDQHYRSPSLKTPF